MLALLRAETEQALADGFTGLHITGEMTWALRQHPAPSNSHSHEARVNALLPDLPFVGLCQYDRRRSGPDVLLDMLWTHSRAAFGGQVYENHHYIPSTNFRPPSRARPGGAALAGRPPAERELVEDQLRRMSAALMAIARPARQMATFLDQETLLREIVRSVQTVTGAYNANVFLLTDAGLVLAAGYGGYEDGRPPIGYRLELGQGIIGHCRAQTGCPLLVPDVRQDPRYIPLRRASSHPLRTGRAGEARRAPPGVLDVQSTAPDAFDLIALEMLERAGRPDGRRPGKCSPLRRTFPAATGNERPPRQRVPPGRGGLSGPTAGDYPPASLRPSCAGAAASTSMTPSPMNWSGFWARVSAVRTWASACGPARAYPGRPLQAPAPAEGGRLPLLGGAHSLFEEQPLGARRRRPPHLAGGDHRRADRLPHAGAAAVAQRTICAC